MFHCFWFSIISFIFTVPEFSDADLDTLMDEIPPLEPDFEDSWKTHLLSPSHLHSLDYWRQLKIHWLCLPHQRFLDYCWHLKKVQASALQKIPGIVQIYLAVWTVFSAAVYSIALVWVRLEHMSCFYCCIFFKFEN